MTDMAIIQLMREAMYVTIIVSAPILGIATIVGLIVSIFQTTTSIQEQTLTFVPKIISIFAIMVFLMAWMVGFLKGYTAKLFLMIANL